jgi:hypothetical protein
LRHALDFLLPPNVRKQDEALKRFKDGGADAKRRCWILLTDKAGDISEILDRARRKAQLH